MVNELHRSVAMGEQAMPILEAGRPVSGRERIFALDVLRGFAMVGVLVAYTMWSLGTAPETQWSELDRVLDGAAGFLVDGKFYTILAFLFGLGFSIQLDRASSDASAVETYCRRLAALAGIGLVHALLLRNGDILLPYALTGFLLIPFRHASDRVLIVSAVAFLLLEAGVRTLWPILGLPAFARPELANAPYLAENAAWVRYWYQTAIFNWPVNLTMFLLGLLAGRRKFVTAIAGRPRSLVAIAVAGITFGVVMYLGLMRLPDAEEAKPLAPGLRVLLFTFHCWGMSSGYAATLLVCLRTRRGAAMLAPLAAVGRLALSNYLTQAGLLVPLCLLFGWFDRFTATTSLLLAAALFLGVQLPFSLWWAKRYQFGPAEWLWRVLTYQRLPAMRLSGEGTVSL
jgi:uncharacterized protein